MQWDYTLNRWEYSEPSLEEEKTEAEKERRAREDGGGGGGGRKRKRTFLSSVLRDEADLLQF